MSMAADRCSTSMAWVTAPRPFVAPPDGLNTLSNSIPAAQRRSSFTLSTAATVARPGLPGMTISTSRSPGSPASAARSSPSPPTSARPLHRPPRATLSPSSGNVLKRGTRLRSPSSKASNLSLPTSGWLRAGTRSMPLFTNAEKPSTTAPALPATVLKGSAWRAPSRRWTDLTGSLETLRCPSRFSSRD